MSLDKFLKYFIWVGLVVIFFAPLFVNGGFYFPFIVPKTLVFRVAVELIFLAFLGLAVLKKEYRPKLNLVLVLFFLYILTVVVSSLMAGTFYHSFWSNNERSEGILLLIHLFMYFIVLSGFLRRLKDWLVIFETSFLSSVLLTLYSLGQHFHIEGFMSSAGGVRITATIGNAGYVAGYLIFNLLFGLLLFYFRKNKYLRWYYIIGILLQIFIVFNTLTRGGIIALIFSAFLFIGYLAFIRLKDNKMIKKASIGALLLFVIFTSIVFVSKESDWVKNSDVLDRVASISIGATTAQNRLMTWESSFQGFKEKPILGYGYENFYQVFDKYFNAKIYRKAGSVIWFDRAHNMVFDRLITGGLVGLLLYLSMLLLPLYYLWKHFFKNKTESGYYIPVIFSLIMIAYLIQNMFIFEALVTYIPLFLVLAFLSQFTPDWSGNISSSKTPYSLLLTVFIIILVPMMFVFNVRPTLANMKFIDALIYSNKNQHVQAYNQFISVLDMKTMGDQEYRQHLGEFVSKVINDPSQDLEENWEIKVAERTEEEFDKQIAEKPKATRNYLMTMRFLLKSYQYDVSRLEKSIELGIQAERLSPTRPQIFYEMGYAKYYLGKHLQLTGQTEKGEDLYDEAVIDMQKAIDLQDQVVESYVNMVMLLLVTDRSDQIQATLDEMTGLGLVYRDPEQLERMANSAIRVQNYEWTKIFYKDLIEFVPENPGYWINLALAYANLGEDDKAIEAANKIGEFGDEFKTQSEAFIQDVKNGVYRK